MAVRLTTLFRRDDEPAPKGRRAIGRELRSRFGFSLIQAPLRKQTTWAGDLDLPEQRGSDVLRTTRPLEAHIDLGPLLRGRVGTRV